MELQPGRTSERMQVSFHHFGDATSLPLRISKADFKVFPVATVAQNLIQVDLTVVNDSVQGDISAKLRMPLPIGATMCRFEFLRDGQWYPAVPVQAKKAKEVVYKEREKGREVAAAAQVQGNVFEIEVFPLRYRCPAQCRIWYNHSDIALPFEFEPGTEVNISQMPGEVSSADSAKSGACCVGDCFGQKHFACYVPFEAAATTQELQRIAIVWDTSGSQEGDHSLRFARLRQLAARCPRAKFDVWTFGISFQRELEAVGVEEAVAALEAVSYDGGTDLTLLPSLVAAVGSAEAVLLFSDGMDSLDRKPRLGEASPPIHCVADQEKMNLSSLRALCLSTGGHLLRGDFLPVLRPQTVLARIQTDQEDEAFFDPDDSFKCCPDHRLQVQWPVGEEGLWLTGTVGGVQRLTAELRVGSCTKEYHFDLSSAAVLTSEAAPLLGYLYARQQYDAVERDGVAMGMDLTRLRAELAVRYAFCSPESTLLMLYEAGQFRENQIDCPKDHPAFSAWKSSQATAEPVESTGGLGQKKTGAQMEAVARLAKKLQDYMTNPIPPTPKRVEQEFAVRRRSCTSADAAAPRMRCLARVAPSDREGYGAAPRARRCAPRMAVASESCAVESADCDEASFVRESLGGAASERCSAESSDCGEASPGSGSLGGLLAFGGGGGEGRGRGGRGGGSGRQDCEAYVQGKEQDYLKVLKSALDKGAWSETYARLRREQGASPSFFLYSAGLLLEHAPGSAEAAARICTSCLEISLQDVQMMRSVGYFLLKAGCSSLGLATLDRVRELAPVEPQSFLDGALARTLRLLRGPLCEDTLRKAVELTTVVLTHVWADRFSEVEWPALVLLHMLCEIGERNGIKDLWPQSVDASLRALDFSAGLVVWLGWDTDKTDIDLHVVEPSGNEVYYSNPRSSVGGHLSKDFTQGYGPEIYLLRDAPVGRYVVKAKYYASHQQSSLTGATSAVIWALRGGVDPELTFDTVRLDRNKEKMEVMTLTVKDGGKKRGRVDEVTELTFTDVDGDVVTLRQSGDRIDEYVNGKLEIEGVKSFSIDLRERSYKDDSGFGKFRPEEDLDKLRQLRDRLFSSAKAAGRTAQHLPSRARGWMGCLIGRG